MHASYTKLFIQKFLNHEKSLFCFTQLILGPNKQEVIERERVLIFGPLLKSLGMLDILLSFSDFHYLE